MQVFWKNGYGATNLPDLLAAMQITRGSFYKAFGDKRSVYIEALKRYDRLHIQAAVAMLGDETVGSGIGRLLRLFAGSIHAGIPREERRGCLMCNAMVELGPTDATVASLTTAMYAAMQKGILVALSDVGSASEHDKSLLSEKSVILTNLYFGSHAISKSGQSTPDWDALIKAIVDVE